MFDPELESFKTSMDLRAYAAHQGYVLDGKESWRGSAVMRHAGSDKVIIKRDLDGLYVYFSVRDEADRGTTIDFAAEASSGKLRRSPQGVAAVGGPPRRSPALPVHPVAPATPTRIAILPPSFMRGLRVLFEVWRLGNFYSEISRIAGRREHRHLVPPRRESGRRASARNTAERCKTAPPIPWEQSPDPWATCR
jgi:hypothetical protein